MKLVVVYHPLHVQVMQAGDSFQRVTNICGKFCCAPEGIVFDSMLLLLVHIDILFHN